MIKIAFVTPIYLPARLTGSGVVVRQWAEFLAQRDGFEVHVVTSNARTARYWYDPLRGRKIKRKVEVINGVHVHRLPCAQYVSAPAWLLARYTKHPFFGVVSQGPCLRGLDNLLARQRFSVIHASPFPHLLNLQTARALEKLVNKPKFIVSPFFHPALPEFYHPRLRTVLHSARIIHTVTRVEAEILQSTFNLSPERLVTLPLGLPLRKYRCLKQLGFELEEFRHRYRLAGRKVVLFAGNKGWLKGTPFLVEALRHLYAKDPSYLLLTLGGQGKFWERLRASLPKEACLDLGFVKHEVKELAFAASDVYVQPSKSESFGLTYLEAWQKKKPVIGADIPSSREIIAQNGGGLLVPFGDSGRLSQLIEVLVSNRELAQRLGHQGYAALHQKFVWEKIAERYAELFTT